MYDIQVAGVEKIHPIPPLNDFEKKLVAVAVPELKSAIQKGVEFSNKTTAALWIGEWVKSYWSCWLCVNIVKKRIK